jgi:hypothetical protein
MEVRVTFCSELSYGMYCRVKLLSTDVSEVGYAAKKKDCFTRCLGGGAPQ